MVNDTKGRVNHLLKKSNSYFKQRNLLQAVELVEECLILSNEDDFIEGKVRANLMLAEIYNVIAQYQGDQDAGRKGFNFAEKAITLAKSHLPDHDVLIDAYIVLAQSYLHQKDFNQAGSLIESARKLSDDKANTNGLIRSLAAKSRLAVAQNKFKLALTEVEQCLQIIDKAPAAIPETTQAEVYQQLCKIYVKRQEHGKVLDYSEKLLILSQNTKDLEKEMTALGNLGIYYAVKAKYKLSMQYFLETLDKSKKINYRSITSNSLINIATIYAQLYNFNDALERYNILLEEYNDVIDDNTRVIIFNNLGRIYFSTERYDLAEEQYNKALELAEASNYREMVARSYAHLSETAAVRGDFDTAHAKADLAEALIQELGEINGKQINLINRGNIHFHQKDYGNAMKLISRGVVLSKRMKDEASEIRGYKLLAKVYKHLGAFEQALKYQMIYSKVQEDFNKEIRNRQIIDLEIKHAIKEKQQEIEQLVKENKLQGLLLEQSDQLAKQNGQLLQVNDELRQFAYVVSHDLKEPLRMIGSYTQLIHKLHKDSFNKDSESYFDFVKEGVGRMNNLLDGLLRYATVGRDDIDMKTVNLTEAVELAVINLSVSIKEVNATVHTENLPKVITIRALWIQVFQNLISNAIKFHREGVDPVVEITGQETDTEVIISIKDNGIGIAEEFKDRIFVIFQRLHARSKYEGTGIGLAICQKIMQRLGGRIWFESEEGEGTTFYCAVPLK